LGINEEILVKNKNETKFEDINTFENSLIFTPSSSSQSSEISTTSSQEFRNSINGTYRIIYHRIQKQLRSKILPIMKEYSSNGHSNSHSNSHHSSRSNSNYSRTKSNFNDNNSDKSKNNNNSNEVKQLATNDSNNNINKHNHSSTPDIRESKDENKSPNHNNLFVKYNHSNTNNDFILRKRSINSLNQNTESAKIESKKLEPTIYKNTYTRSISNSARVQHKSRTNVTAQTKTSVCSIL